MNKKLNYLAVLVCGAPILYLLLLSQAVQLKINKKRLLKSFLISLALGVTALFCLIFVLVTINTTMDISAFAQSYGPIIGSVVAGYVMNLFAFVDVNKHWDDFQIKNITPDSPEWENHKKQLAKLEKLMNEIITECQAILSNDGYITPNKKIIGVILREFEEIRDWYLSTNKILLLSRDTWKLWSIRTIIDSANYDFDDMLFDKVRAFQKQCDMLDESMKDYRY